MIPVESDHRRSTSHGLEHETSLDELLDDGAGVAGSDPGRSGELPPGDGEFEPGQRLEQRAADGGCNVKDG